MKRIEFTAYQEARIDGPESHTILAAEFGCSAMPIRRRRQEIGWKPASRALEAPVKGALGTPGLTTGEDGLVTATSEPLRGGLADVLDAEAYLRERWNLPANEWIVSPAVTVNEWEANVGGGILATLGQVKGSFRKVTDLADVLPRPAIWQGPRMHPRFTVASSAAGTHQIVVTSDHQAPYHDEAKHAAMCAMLRTLCPARIAYIGDLCDYTNISKHADHAVVKAAVDECTDAGVAILEDMREAAPDARFEILAGNHDIRPFSELLLHAERMAGIRSGNLRTSPGRALLSFRDLWRLDELGIELVEDPRGWQHAELELIPGERGLVAWHGYLTGDNVASKSLAQRGVSSIVGHTHRIEHVFKWSKELRCIQQAAVCGASCEARGGGDKSFPTFAPHDRWTQGDVVVTVHPDGEFAIQHALWNGSSLTLGAQRWSA